MQATETEIRSALFHAIREALFVVALHEKMVPTAEAKRTYQDCVSGRTTSQAFQQATWNADVAADAAVIVIKPRLADRSP